MDCLDNFHNGIHQFLGRKSHPRPARAKSGNVVNFLALSALAWENKRLIINKLDMKFLLNKYLLISYSVALKPIGKIIETYLLSRLHAPFGY
ncbi:MAG: hypothetical protein KAH22_11315, partial [Thiotrichaceae bacterium]|nr:hypothetical protein [Thiotrichaceae bacterium]